jgi:hypothetical protein
MSRENSEIYSDRFPFMSKPPKVSFFYTEEIFYILVNKKKTIGNKKEPLGEIGLA